MEPQVTPEEIAAYHAAAPARAAEREKEARARWLELLPGIGSSAWKIDEFKETHEGFDSTAFQKVKNLDVYSDEPDAEDGKTQNIVIQGPPGCGKTRMAAWFCHQMTAVRFFGFTEWVTESDFFEVVGNLGRNAEREEAKQKLEDWTITDLLFFDDLGSCSLTEPRASRFFQMIDRRYKAGSPTVFTTNRTPSELSGLIERFWLSTGCADYEAKDNAAKVLRRIYGMPGEHLCTVIECSTPPLKVVER